MRTFQARTGITPDGVAGPRTVHRLARYAKESRELRRDLAAYCIRGTSASDVRCVY